MPDPILEIFMERQRRELTQLAARSDLLDAEWVDPQHALLHYTCTGLVCGERGLPQRHSDFGVGLYFSPEHLRRVEPMGLVQLIWPEQLFHPNVSWPFLCVGAVRSGIRATELAHSVFEILVGRKRTVLEAQALNKQAAVWYRHHADQCPIDRRPLLWRAQPGALSGDPAAPLQARGVAR